MIQFKSSKTNRSSMTVPVEENGKQRKLITRFQWEKSSWFFYWYLAHSPWDSPEHWPRKIPCPPRDKTDRSGRDAKETCVSWSLDGESSPRNLPDFSWSAPSGKCLYPPVKDKRQSDEKENSQKVLSELPPPPHSPQDDTFTLTERFIISSRAKSGRFHWSVSMRSRRTCSFQSSSVTWMKVKSQSQSNGKCSSFSS